METKDNSLIELRTEAGKLDGKLDPERMILHVRVRGQERQYDLRDIVAKHLQERKIDAGLETD